MIKIFQQDLHASLVDSPSPLSMHDIYKMWYVSIFEIRFLLNIVLGYQVYLILDLIVDDKVLGSSPAFIIYLPI